MERNATLSEGSPLKTKKVGLIQLWLALFLALFQSLLVISHPATMEGENNAKKGHCPSPSSAFLLIIAADLPHIAYYCKTEKQCERERKLAACFHLKSHWFEPGFVHFLWNHYVFQLTSENWSMYHNISTNKYCTSWALLSLLMSFHNVI